MAIKFYAVKVGRTTGIFNTWDDCKKQVDGFGGAIYKSFPTAKEAMEYLGWGSSNSNNNNNNDINSSNHTTSDNTTYDNTFTANISKDIAIAYVDGSFNISTGEFGYGVIFFYNGEEIHLLEGFNDPSLATMRNVAGEIKGSEAAMKYAVANGIPKLNIYHDYEGVARWCTGEWKANKEGTIAYKNYYESIKDKVSVEFIKVKGHSGDKYNDLADELAKKACGVI